MGLYQLKLIPSDRIGTLRTLVPIRDSTLLEFGCMGHMDYGRVFLGRMGVSDAYKFYSTHVDETDIVPGGVRRFSSAVIDIAQRDEPGLLFLLPSAVPEIIGTDLPVLHQELQSDYPDMRLLPFDCGDLDVNQHQGIRKALTPLSRTLPVDVERTVQPSFNIIGSRADLFHLQAGVAEIACTAERTLGMRPLRVMTSDMSAAQIEWVGGTNVNLVIRREGLPATEHLQKRPGTPYLFARPYGIQDTCEWTGRVSWIVGTSSDRSFVEGEREEALRLISPVLPMFRHVAWGHPEDVCAAVGGYVDIVQGTVSFADGELSLSKGARWRDSLDMADGNLPYRTEG